MIGLGGLPFLSVEVFFFFGKDCNKKLLQVPIVSSPLVDHSSLLVDHSASMLQRSPFHLSSELGLAEKHYTLKPTQNRTFYRQQHLLAHLL